MKKETTRIAQYFLDASEGNPWHGDSVEKILAPLTSLQAIQKPIPNAHSIWEVVLHLNNWRRFVLEKLQGNEHFEVDLNTSMDWPTVENASPEAWQATLARFKSLTKDLKIEIERFDEQQLDQVMDGRKYSWYFLLQGIIHHDIYHSGQIKMLHKALESRKD